MALQVQPDIAVGHRYARAVLAAEGHIVQQFHPAVKRIYGRKGRLQGGVLRAVHLGDILRRLGGRAAVGVPLLRRLGEHRRGQHGQAHGQHQYDTYQLSFHRHPPW